MYNTHVLNSLLKETGELNITLTKKAFHFPKVKEMHDFYEHCYKETGNTLLDPESGFNLAFEDYQKAVYHKTGTKAELDHLLKKCKMQIIYELQMCFEFAS